MFLSTFLLFQNLLLCGGPKLVHMTAEVVLSLFNMNNCIFVKAQHVWKSLEQRTKEFNSI